MSDDIAFKIQLGLVLPKLDAQLKASLGEILEEIMDYLSKGTFADDETPTLDEVKALFLQDLEIYLDKTLLPALDAKRNPPAEPVAEEEASEAEEADAEAAEAAEEQEE
ncbi:hypothetical protein [Marinomonas sp. THO17]|uniref:hypothetical protein n=1 Tax=Marinomonas sp. THO17 TaxID=3149048 RepID=UPI00336BEC0C